MSLRSKEATILINIQLCYISVILTIVPKFRPKFSLFDPLASFDLSNLKAQPFFFLKSYQITAFITTTKIMYTAKSQELAHLVLNHI